MGCGASVADDDGGWGKSDSEVRDGVFTGSTPARAVAVFRSATAVR